jgi:hypothetical protein
MKQRYPLAALAAIGLTAAGGLVYAEAATEEPGPPDRPAAPAVADAITLPTGDVVRLTADGSYVAEPGEGSAVHNVVEPDGDRLVIPVEAIGGLAAGEYTYEQFNIDALARNGISDAGDAAAIAPLAAEAEPEAEGTVDVAFTGLWPDGTAPEESFVEWVDLDTGESDYLAVEGGTGTLALAPGDYHLAVMLTKRAETAAIGGVIEADLGADGASVVFDGGEAVPTGFDLDREAVTERTQFRVFSFAPETEEGVAAGLTARGDWALSALPTAAHVGGRDVGMSLRGELSSPKGAEEPYSYSLSEWHFGGIPEDAVFHVDEEDLARINMDYQSLGVDAEMLRLNLATHPAHVATGYLVASMVALPSQRTEFYSAAPEVTWSQVGTLGYGDEGAPNADVLHHTGVLEPGATLEETWNQGPVTAGVDIAGAEYYFPRFVMVQSEEALFTNPEPFSSGDAEEAVASFEYPGTTTLSRDGEVLNRNDEGGGLATDLSLITDGRYTLRYEVSREASWTPLGTAANAEWEFAITQGDEDLILPVSVVNFDAEGIANGYAEADEDQEVTLEYLTQPGAEQQECTAMTFEVSYDDGATWDEVAIDRQGNRAAAELEHPDGAAFVSVRFTASDAAGNTVSHSTIRSYGLR